MATLMNSIQVLLNGTFDFTPQWDYSPLGNLDGCPPEFVGTYILFPLGENAEEIFSVTSFDNTTGRIIGTVNVSLIPASGIAFGYGLAKCDTVDSYPSLGNINYSVQELYMYYSKNPIEPAITTEPSAVTEVQIFAETYRSSEVFESLGTFSFRADISGNISVDISKILDAHLSNIIRGDNLSPFISYGYSQGPLFWHSCLYYISTRYKSSGTWSSWIDSEQKVIVNGGRAYEDLNTENYLLTTGFLTSQSQILSPINKATNLTLLFGQKGTYYIQVTDYDENGGLIDTVLNSILIGNHSTVYFFSHNPVGKSSVAQLYDSNENLLDTIDIRTRTDVPDSTEFLYLSGSGGFRNLSCEGAKISLIESAQEIYEREKPSAYFMQNDLSNFNIWKSKGIKRYKISTGFLPQEFISEQIQDFLLSPMRYVWDNGKLIPIIVTTKSAEFLNSKELNLRSFTFEYRHSFEDNIYNNR